VDDSVELTLVHNRLRGICREMGIAMMKTAHSPVFNEGFDFVCALFDRDARMIGQAEYNPSMLGAANFAVRWLLEEIGAEQFRPGDVWVHNDPYRAAATCRSTFSCAGSSTTVSCSASPQRSAMSRRSAAWPPGLWPATPQRSTRRASACRRSG